MPAKYLAFKGGDFRDEEMGEGAIGDEKNRTRGGEDSKLCHVVAMSNVDTLQTHEPSSVSARVSIYDAMSNIDTLYAAMQRRRGSRVSCYPRVADAQLSCASGRSLSKEFLITVTRVMLSPSRGTRVPTLKRCRTPWYGASFLPFSLSPSGDCVRATNPLMIVSV